MENSVINKTRELIETDLEWRLDEIAFYTNLLNNIRILNSDETEKKRVENERDRLRKLLVFVLYAHFEGFCRFSFEAYVNVINEDNVPINKAIDVLAVSSLQKIFGAYENSKEDANKDSDEFSKLSKRLYQRSVLLKEIDDFKKAGVIKLPISSDHRDKSSVIYTESNLSPEVFEKILDRLGLDVSAFGLNVEALRIILNQFLLRRHGIAHGDGKFRDGINEKDYNAYKTAFDNIISKIPIAIFNALSGEFYIKPEFRHTT